LSFHRFFHSSWRLPAPLTAAAVPAFPRALAHFKLPLFQDLGLQHLVSNHNVGSRPLPRCGMHAIYYRRQQAHTGLPRYVIFSVHPGHPPAERLHSHDEIPTVWTLRFRTSCDKLLGVTGYNSAELYSRALDAVWDQANKLSFNNTANNLRLQQRIQRVSSRACAAILCAAGTATARRSWARPPDRRWIVRG